MTTSTLAAPAPSLTRQVLRLISRRKAIKMGQLRRGSRLFQELQLDLLDLVDIILTLESYFDLRIPDEVPFVTVGDLVDYVAAETLGAPLTPYAPPGGLAEKIIPSK